jgi:hypothetical protein
MGSLEQALAACESAGSWDAEMAEAWWKGWDRAAAPSTLTDDPSQTAGGVM